MSGGRSSRIQALVGKQAARRGARVAGVQDACTAAVKALPVRGAGLSAMSGAKPSYPLYSTDTISARLEELQLTLGEGPCVDAFARGLAIVTPDLRTGELQDNWPVFAEAALEAGARAVFAFPLQIGAISPGVLDLYSSVPRELDDEMMADAMAFADIATLILLDARIDTLDRPGGGDSGHTVRDSIRDGRPDLGGYRAQIDQATGMLTVQLGVGIEEAFIRLRAYAYAHDRRLSEVAEDVLARRLRFSPGPGPEPGRDPSNDT